MMTTNFKQASSRPFVLHSFVGFICLIYSVVISNTSFVNTGIQFIAPAIILICTHLLILWVNNNLRSGYAGVVFYRSLITCVFTFFMIFLAQLFAPMPSYAQRELFEPILEPILGLLTVLFCLFILLVIIAIPIVIIFLIYKFCVFLFKKTRENQKNKLNDLASIILALTFLTVASLEGLQWSYSFSKKGQVTASYDVAASTEQVWLALNTATSPDYSLPILLKFFPQPVAVLKDEGVSLGSKRLVKIVGREGQGELSLEVVERTATRTKFKVIADTSPISNWAHIKYLTYEVQPKDSNSELSVTLDYEGLLAPAFVFNKMMYGASYLAMQVLASDSKARSEVISKRKIL